MKEDRPSWTARWVATQRARLAESRPSDGDPVGEAALYASLAVPGLSSRLLAPTRMAARTRFFDNRVLEARDRGVEQIVVLGAGYDGRSLRFSNIGSRWIEVDHPASQADKVARLRQVGARTQHVSFTSADLISSDLNSVLERAGHDRHLPTLWIAEGLLPYLPRPAIGRVLAVASSRSATRSALALNVLVFDPCGFPARVVRGSTDILLAAVGERRRSRFAPGDLESLLGERGWSITLRDEQAASHLARAHFLAVSARPLPAQGT